jgi:hypothetical protein
MALYICVYFVSSKNPGNCVELDREGSRPISFIYINFTWPCYVCGAAAAVDQINNGVYDALGKVPAVNVSPRTLHKTDCYESDKSYLIHNVHKEDVRKAKSFRAEES